MMAAAPAFTTVKGPLVQDPNGELAKVLKPSARDLERRARVKKVYETAGLEFPGSAIFAQNRYYGGSMFADMCSALGVEPSDQVGVAAMIVALADADYKPFHKKVGTFYDVLHSFMKEIAAEVDDFETPDLVKVFGALVKLNYQGSPKYLLRDMLRELAGRATDEDMSAKDMAALLDYSATCYFVPEDDFYRALATQAPRAGDFSGEDAARMKSALSRTLQRQPHLKDEEGVKDFVSKYA